ncbi:MAG: efflux RND transporter periplasmic adaptor subunit [Terracidiphilus sp.]|nr:efflux RND transporter periplasmic adaptor subunit [Terracidiphilus sp.]
MITSLQPLFRRRSVRLISAAVVLVCAGAFIWARYSSKRPTAPVYQVRQEEFLDSLEFRGTLKAMKTITIAAPANAGDLQVVKIATDGSQVAAGDVVVEFDASRTRQQLDQYRIALKSAQAQIDQSRAQGRLKEEADTTAVMKAKYNLQVARLDASKQEIVSRIEGDEANLKVADAERALVEAEEDLKADTAQNRATLSGGEHAKEKAQYDVQRSENALAQMTLKAPSAGTISLMPVWHSGGVSAFKAGDQVWPGAPLAALPDIASLRVVAHVDETERGRLSVGQAATLQLDAIADRQFTARIDRIGTIATTDFSAGWPFPRNFDLEIVLDQPDARLRPGMSVQITIVVDRIPNAISIPAQATFQREGRTIVYVWDGSRFAERTVQVQRRSRDRLLISTGLMPGDRIALKDPTIKQ